MRDGRRYERTGDRAWRRTNSADRCRSCNRSTHRQKDRSAFWPPPGHQWCWMAIRSILSRAGQSLPCTAIPGARTIRKIMLCLCRPSADDDDRCDETIGNFLWQSTSGRPMFAAGGRMFVDVAGSCHLSEGNMLVNVLGDPTHLSKTHSTTILSGETSFQLPPDDHRDRSQAA